MSEEKKPREWKLFFNDSYELGGSVFPAQNSPLGGFCGQILFAVDREAYEDLKQQALFMREALKYIARTTYGTELCNTDAENNEILAGHYWSCSAKAQKALEQFDEFMKASGK